MVVVSVVVAVTVVAVVVAVTVSVDVVVTVFEAGDVVVPVVVVGTGAMNCIRKALDCHVK